MQYKIDMSGMAKNISFHSNRLFSILFVASLSDIRIFAIVKIQLCDGAGN